MHVPKSIKVGASNFKVRLVPDEWEDQKDKGSFFLGQMRYGNQEIDVALRSEGKALPEASIADTFLHEVIHAVSRTYGIGLTENQTGGLAGGLLQVIRDNSLDFRKGK